MTTTAEAALGRLATTDAFVRWGVVGGEPSWVTVRAPLTAALIERHRAGVEVIGAYPAADGVARAGVIDVDLHVDGGDPSPGEVAANERYAVRKLDDLAALGAAALLVRGHAAGSYHLFFWTAPVASARLGRWLAAFTADRGPLAVDTFPSADGGGNAVRLPGRHHRRADQWSAAWDGAGWESWPAAFDRLFALPDNPARLFPDPPRDTTAAPPAGGAGGGRPGDVFDLLVPVEDVLAAYGWANGREDGERVRWTRPGKDGGVSASVKGNTVWVYTSSVPGLTPSTATRKPYTAFGLVAALEFGGDFRRAAAELAKRGYSTRPARPTAAFGGGRPGGTASGGPKPYNPPPPYVPFPLDALPAVVRDLATECEAAMRCDPVFAALPALGVCAGMIGASRVIELKKSWREPAMTWAVVVGESGTLKTPPYKLAVRPVVKLQADHFKRNAAEMEAYRRDLREYEREKKRCKDDDPGDPPAQPKCLRLCVRDTTVEALAGILNDNRARMLVARDEVSGWLASFNQYKARGGSDLANWLELHGLGTLAVDRKSGDVRTIYIPEVGVSLCGGVQPGVLRKCVSEEQMAAGIPARLLFAYPTRRPKRWTEADIGDDVYKKYADAVGRLAELRPDTDAEGDPTPVALKMTPDAKAAWVEFYNAFADRQAQADGEIAAAFSKLEGYAARLSLIHYVCEQVTAGKDARDPIPLGSVRAGIRMARWFADEAERVYRLLGEEDEERELNALVELVKRLAERNDGRVTANTLRRANARKYRSREAAEADLDALAEQGLGTWVEGEKPARGGHRVRAFIPRIPSYPSYPRPEDDNDPPPPPSDDRVTPSDSPPPPGIPPGSPTEGPTMGSVEDPPGGHGRGYEGYEGDRENASPTDSASGGQGGEPRVGQAAVESAASGVKLVADADELARVVAAVASTAGPVGLDTETTGLDPRTARVRLLQLAAGPDAFLIDLFAFPRPKPALANLFAALAEKEVVGHNLAFDLRMLAPLGFTPGRVFDTMLASQVLHAGGRTATHAPLRHGLDDAADRELGRALDKSQQTADWSKPLTPAMLAYAAADAAVLVPLAEALVPRLAAAGLSGTADREMRALPGVAWAAPVAIDRPAWLGLAAAAAAERDALAADMDALAPDPNGLPGMQSRNWNSTTDVAAAFAAVGIKLESTDDDALAAIDHPLAAAVRKYRSAAKRVGTYGKKWLDKHAPNGEVLCRWNQLGAEGGRMSAAAPNLQQIPRDAAYRRCFVARPGAVLVKADYSQIELRVAAGIAGERVMIEAYRAGADLHALTAAGVLGKPAGDVTKADRQLAKAVNFGLLFGMGWRGLRAYAESNYGVDLTETQARAYRDQFFRTYPSIRAWHGRVRAGVERLFAADPAAAHEARTEGGRRLVLPVAAGAKNDRYPNVTEALNFPVQGTAADGMKAAVALLWERRDQCPGAVPVLFVHDEIVVEVPARSADAAAVWLRQCMTDGMAPLVAPVPVEVEVTVGPTWGG